MNHTKEELTVRKKETNDATQRVNIRMDIETFENLRYASFQEKRPMKDIVKEALSVYFKKKKNLP